MCDAAENHLVEVALDVAQRFVGHDASRLRRQQIDQVPMPALRGDIDRARAVCIAQHAPRAELQQFDDDRLRRTAVGGLVQRV